MLGLVLVLTMAALCCLVLTRCCEPGLLVEDAESAPVLQELEVTLSPEAREARVSKSGMGTVTFYGNVTMEMPPGFQRVTVTLTASVDTGWETFLSMVTCYFVESRSYEFQLSIVVPPATPCVTVGHVSVVASAESPTWEGSATAYATVTVGQYYKMKVGIMRDVGAGQLGANITGIIRITNQGNGDDSFRISLEDPQGGISWWDFQENVTVPAFGVQEVPWTMTISEDLEVPDTGLMLVVSFRVVSSGTAEDGGPLETNYDMNVPFPGVRDDPREDGPNELGYLLVLPFVALVGGAILWHRRSRAGREPMEAIEVTAVRPKAD